MDQPTSRSSRSGQKVIWACPTGSEITGLPGNTRELGLRDVHKPLVNDGFYGQGEGEELSDHYTKLMFCFCKSNSQILVGGTSTSEIRCVWQCPPIFVGCTVVPPQHV